MKVLISRGFGAGWSTWNSGEVAKYMRTFEPLITALEKDEKIDAYHPAVIQLKKDCMEKFGEDYVCMLGLDGLVVEDVTPPFRINEYDGAESISSPGDDNDWIMN